VYEVILASAMI